MPYRNFVNAVTENYLCLKYNLSHFQIGQRYLAEFYTACKTM